MEFYQTFIFNRKHFKFKITIEKKGYSATCLKKNGGICTQSNTWDKLLKNIKEAIELYEED